MAVQQNSSDPVVVALAGLPELVPVLVELVAEYKRLPYDAGRPQLVAAVRELARATGVKDTRQATLRVAAVALKFATRWRAE